MSILLAASRNASATPILEVDEDPEDCVFICAIVAITAIGLAAIGGITWLESRRIAADREVKLARIKQQVAYKKIELLRTGNLRKEVALEIARQLQPIQVSSEAIQQIEAAIQAGDQAKAANLLQRNIERSNIGEINFEEASSFSSITPGDAGASIEPLVASGFNDATAIEETVGGTTEIELTSEEREFLRQTREEIANGNGFSADLSGIFGQTNITLASKLNIGNIFLDYNTEWIEPNLDGHASGSALIDFDLLLQGAGDATLPLPTFDSIVLDLFNTDINFSDTAGINVTGDLRGIIPNLPPAERRTVQLNNFMFPILIENAPENAFLELTARRRVATQAVPEPSSLVLTLVGLAALWLAATGCVNGKTRQDGHLSLAA